MQGINLANRPFVNRRPVWRLAVLLWIVGAGLLIHNFRQYTGHWQGSAKHREDFARLAGLVADERQEFNEIQQDLKKVSVRSENQHTGFLNQLIAFRTFPWSALFDDLEDVVPLNVKLLSVKPNVHLKAVPKKARRKPQRRRPRPTTAARNESGDTDSEESATSTRRQSSDEVEPLRRDEVALQLACIAKDEEAVVEFIEMLYEDPSFRSPYLPGELIEQNGTVKFALSAVYLTGQGQVSPEANGAPTEVETVASQTSEASDPEVTEGASGSEANPEGSVQASDSRSLAGAGSRAATAAPVPESSASSGQTASRTTATRTPEARRSVTRRSEARGSGARDEDGSVERRERSAVPRSRIRPRPLTGSRSGSDGTAGTGSSGTTPGRGDGATGNPGFSDPPASAPPRVRRGSVTGNSEPREAKA